MSAAKGNSRVLVIDVGGTHVKVLATGEKTPRKFDSGPTLTPAQMVKGVKAIAKGWSWSAVSIGYPGVVVKGKILREPHNLGKGWAGYDFEHAFGVPTRVINDAAMQALGVYKRGALLFLGLGTGLGSAMIFDGHLAPLELGHMPWRRGRTFEDEVGVAGLERLGKKKWRKRVTEIVEVFRAALQPDDIVLGGGNAKKLKALPAGVRTGENADAFTGGFRLWEDTATRRSH